MPSKPGKEHDLITRFLRAYEHGSWTDAELDWLDEHQDGAVELVAKRRSDGVTLAIEHTVIQPHPQEKEDFARFKRTFPADIRDPSLEIPHGFLYVDVPREMPPRRRRHCRRETSRASIARRFRGLPTVYPAARKPAHGRPCVDISIAW